MPVSFVEICQWNAWANVQVLETLRETGGKPDRALAAFEHVLTTELTWLDRMAGDETAFLAQWTQPSLEKCEALQARSAERLAALVQQLENGYENESFPYKTSKGVPFTDRVDDVLTHMFFHSTQYRGEALGLVGELGRPVPDLDLIFWKRFRNQ